MWFTWPYIMVPVNIINVWITWMVVQYWEPQTPDTYCWEVSTDAGDTIQCIVYHWE